jgi:phosphoribosylformylglycinamidine synthase
MAIGGNMDHLALLDNFCWCSSTEPERLYQLKRAAEACYDYAVAYGTPFISGKDSMFNDFKGFDERGKPVLVSVPPTLLISSISVMDDVRKAVTEDAKVAGHTIYLLGDTKDELGGSEFMHYIGEVEGVEYAGGSVPQVTALVNTRTYRAYQQAVAEGLVASGAGLDRGGLAIAVVKCAIAGQLGVSIDLARVGIKSMNNLGRLFSESNGRILVTVAPSKQKKFERVMKNVSITNIGVVTADKRIIIRHTRQEIVSYSLKEVTTAYRAKFKDA